MARGTVGTLNVKLNASTRGFTTGMKRAGKRVNRFTAGVRTAKRALMTLGVGVGVGLIARGMLRAAKAAVQMGDAIAKTAQKIGLSTTALQELQFAAQLSGVETRTFNMAIQRMSRRMAEAAIGTGEAKDAIKELGIDAKKMQEVGTEKALYAIARAFGAVENPMKRLRLAFKLFDSEGVAMVNLMSQGDKGMRRLAARAQELGIVVSNIDLAGLEGLKDAMTGVGMAVKGASMTAVGRNAPLLSLMTELTGEVVAAIGRISIGDKGVIQWTAEKVAAGMDFGVDMAQFAADVGMTTKALARTIRAGTSKLITFEFAVRAMAQLERERMQHLADKAIGGDAAAIARAAGMSKQSRLRSARELGAPGAFGGGMSNAEKEAAKRQARMEKDAKRREEARRERVQAMEAQRKLLANIEKNTRQRMPGLR